MTPFIPEVGALFGVTCQMHIQRADGERLRDTSYENNILRCVAVDQQRVVCDIVHGLFFSSARLMLLRSNYTMHPIGPDVAKALGLIQENPSSSSPLGWQRTAVKTGSPT